MNVTSTVKRALATLGYYRESMARVPFQGVAVLAYHGVRNDALPDGAMRFESLHVRAQRFAEHCAVIRDLRCTPLSFAEWRDTARRGHVPRSSVMLTFDDGYRSVLTLALPILERYEIPAIVFVCTGPVARGERFWYDAVAEREGEAAVDAAKALDLPGWRMATEPAAMPVADDDPHAPLTVDELRTLAKHPLITIGAHTVSHAILARAPLSVQAEEIGESRARLEEWTGQSVRAFAYPNGRPRVDYSAHTIEILRACGFEHAFTTAEMFAVPADDPFEHPRFTMLQDITASELAHRLALSWPRLDAVTT